MRTLRRFAAASILLVSCRGADIPAPESVSDRAAILEEDFLTIVVDPLLDAAQQRRVSSISARRSVSLVRLARLATSASERLTAGDSVRLQLDGSRRLLAVGQRVTRRNGSDISWAGPIVGDRGWASLVLTSKGVTGTVQIGEDTYTIEPLGRELHAIALVQPGGLPQLDAEPLVPPDTAPSASEPSGSPALRLATADLVGDTRIDVLIVYTDAAQNAHGDIQAHAQNAIDQANQSYVNSVISAELNLVATASVSYSEGGKSSNQQLDELTNPSDNLIDDVHVLRNLHQADVVVLLTAGFTDDVCGRGWLNSTSAYGFTVVGWWCAAAPRWTLAHEIGHNFGARHETANDNGTPYSYGHGYWSVSSNFRTIMSTIYACACPRVQYWSNPNVIYPWTNEAMGTAANEHNARVLNERKAALSYFRYPTTVINGSNTIARYQSLQYTAASSGGVSPITHMWRTRSGWHYGWGQFTWGPWSNWYSTGTTNYTYTSVGVCGVNSHNLEVQATDGRSDVFGHSKVIFISNPC